MDDTEYWYNYGSLGAYVELLRTGIRQICLPSLAIRSLEALSYVDAQIEKAGFKHITVVAVAVGSTGNRNQATQKIIFVDGIEELAEELKTLLETERKTIPLHRKIGEILGYATEKIDQFCQGYDE